MPLIDVILRLEEYCNLYDKLESVYKNSQLSTEKVDTGVLNEMRYSHRAIVDLIKLLIENSKSGICIDSFEVEKHIGIALRGVAIAINDTIDLTKDYCKYLNKQFEEDYSGCSISIAYGREEYKSLWFSIIEIEKQIVISREFRSDRLKIYFDIASSEHFKNIVRFNCSSYATLDSLKNQKIEIKKENRKFWMNLSLSIIVGIATIIGAFYTYLSYAK